ncbi:unnamed protein product [Polarella glacialis]|uniref:Uncharacterized protein n=1 Tax=Polarella glacialis TaxID=89957 RepID=A0A813K4S7_POLGL|nr:unnamed protein product [Polarella glacialis]CAE8706044.1 unnamed protein product [Polarella glacialis]
MALAALIIVASSEDSFWIGLDWIGLDRRFSSACPIGEAVGRTSRTALNAGAGPSLWHIKTRSNKQQASKQASNKPANEQTNAQTKKQTTQDDKQRHEQGSEIAAGRFPCVISWLAEVALMPLNCCCCR